MPLLFLLLPLLGVFALNLPKHRVAVRYSAWLVGAVAAAQAFFTATGYILGWWQAIDSLAASLPLPFGLEVDAISATLLTAIAIVCLAANAVGFHGSDRDRVLARSLLLTCLAGMDGIVMVRDLFSAYVFLEIIAVCCFVLIAIERKAEALSGAFNYFILSGLATFALLIANALVFMQAGSLAFADVAAAVAAGSTTTRLALVLYVAAFCLKSGVAPFHSWLPDAHASAPSAVSVLLSGVVIKAAGVYMVIRLMSTVFVSQPGPAAAFMALGTFSIALGAFAAIGQTDMKRVLAFSSVSQMGYIVLAAGLGTPLAIFGAVFHLVNHAMFKSLLFVNAASVKEQVGTTDMGQLGGLTERMPVTGWTTVVGLLSAAGVPPLAGFWSKLFIIVALVTSGHMVYAGLALLMSVVTLGYFLLMQRNVFFGQLRRGLEELTEARPSLSGTAVILAALIACIGLLFPAVLAALGGFGLA